MVAYNLDRNGVFFTQNLQLDQQAFTQVTCGYAGRIEVLDDLERLLNVLKSVLSAFSNLFERDGDFAAVLVNCPQVAIFVEISDDRVAGEPDIFINRGQTQLPFEVVRQSGRFCQKVFERRLLENLGLTRARRAVVEIIVETLEINVGVRIIHRLRLGRSCDVDGTFPMRP